MQKVFTLLTLIVVLTIPTTFAQNALKLSKQKTSFFYTQVNLHAGYMEDGAGSSWGLANHGPNNQVAFTYLKKNQKVLQRGYVRFASLASYKIQVAIPFTNAGFGNESDQLNFKLLNASLKFKTKWDRTSFSLGYKSLPYGHNPKIDPVSSFLPNPTKMDIGFAQDLGIFIKTAVSEKLDLDVSLTSGGVLNQSLVKMSHFARGAETQTKTDVNTGVFSYKNTWLSTVRLGNQSFNRNEWGLILVSGRVANPDLANDFSQINRFGAEWIYKHYEKIKISQQLTGGIINSEIASNHTSINYMGGAEFFILRNFVFGTTVSHEYKAFNDGTERQDLALYNCITYNVSPHTRIRINNYFGKDLISNNQNWGLYLQFVTGFGKRS